MIVYTNDSELLEMLNLAIIMFSYHYACMLYCHFFRYTYLEFVSASFEVELIYLTCPYYHSHAFTFGSKMVTQVIGIQGIHYYKFFKVLKKFPILRLVNIISRKLQIIRATIQDIF